MPIFKGFEKNEGGDLLAKVDYPNARKHTRYWTKENDSHIRTTPAPRTELLNEDNFKAKFKFGFDTLKALPFKEDGHDLKPLIAQQAEKLAANIPNLGPQTKPGHGGAP